MHAVGGYLRPSPAAGDEADIVKTCPVPIRGIATETNPAALLSQRRSHVRKQFFAEGRITLSIGAQFQHAQARPWKL